MSTRISPKILLLALVFGPACGPPPVSEECIAIDEHLGVPAERQWCDEYFQPWKDPNLIWNGQPPGVGGPVCLPPQSDGSCQVCPIEEVLPAIETRMQALVAAGEPQCQIEHWEVGCMRTEENGKVLGWGIDGSDYCCFEVALWGPGCTE